MTLKIITFLSNSMTFVDHMINMLWNEAEVRLERKLKVWKRRVMRQVKV